jgi:hypothetical protein
LQPVIQEVVFDKLQQKLVPLTNQPDNDRSQPDKEAAITALRSARDFVLAVVR